MVKKIKQTLSIQIPKLGNIYKLILYFDDYYYTVSWFIYTNLQEADSQRGYVLFLISDTGKYMSLILDYHT